MELNYKYAESTVKPVTLEVSEDMVYLRKDITSITRTPEQGEATVYWTYQEAALAPQEFNEYTGLLTAENAIKGTNDSDNIVRIMAGQEMGDTNLITIMEAIADLYEIVATMASA